MKTSFLLHTVFLFLLLPAISRGQDKIKNIAREPAVAGTFYSSDPTQLSAQLDIFFKKTAASGTDNNIQAIIAPHAGYVFSGEVAASAYSRLNPEIKYSRIFIIGTSHQTLLNGASVYNKGNYKTPLGEVEVDIGLADQLIKDNKLFKYESQAHSKEHSLEVQLPFLQRRLNNPFKIVPIVIGTQSINTCQKIAEILKPWFNRENLFVISTDFSHYPSYVDAKKIDKITGNAIALNSPELFIKTIVKNSDNPPPRIVNQLLWLEFGTYIIISDFGNSRITCKSY